MDSRSEAETAEGRGPEWPPGFSLSSTTLATTQAERKAYAAPYLAAGKPVWVIGLSFDSKTRRLTDHCVERWPQSSY